jgi:ubiquinone/menaquinone biosynthesis C-methylase UbiE
VITTGRGKVVDLQADTGTFALRLAGRKAFTGRVYSFDSNLTLLERARQRAQYMNLHPGIEFKQFDGVRVPLEDRSAEIVVSIFDIHRHPAEQFLAEAVRLLAPDGYLLIGEVIERVTPRTRLQWGWRWLHLKYIQKKPEEADCTYVDREELIRLIFGAGFRQVVIQGLKVPAAPADGVFSLVAATK